MVSLCQFKVSWILCCYAASNDEYFPNVLFARYTQTGFGLTSGYSRLSASVQEGSHTHFPMFPSHSFSVRRTRGHSHQRHISWYCPRLPYVVTTCKDDLWRFFVEGEKRVFNGIGYPYPLYVDCFRIPQMCRFRRTLCRKIRYSSNDVNDIEIYSSCMFFATLSLSSVAFSERKQIKHTLQLSKYWCRTSC